MTYLSGKAEKRKSVIRYSVYGIIFVGVFVFWVDVKKIVYPIIEPAIIQYGKMKVTLGNIPEFISTYSTTRETLIQKNKELEITIERLENQLQEQESHLKESRVLADETTVIGNSTLVMYPLMQDITKLYSTILLSKGFRDGVEIGEYVHVRGLQPVCMIEEVHTETSRCTLLSASGVSTDVVTEGTSSVAFTVTGRGGGTFLGSVPRDTVITVGDSVYLRGDQSMKLGTVVDVIHNNQDTAWHVFIRGAYNPVTTSIFYYHKK